MKTISLDLRERILTAYDAGDVTRAEVGQRFRVSEAMVKKLLQQRRRTGEIGPLETLLDRMREAGVRAVKLFPGHYTFGLNEWCVGDLLETLELENLLL